MDSPIGKLDVVVFDCAEPPVVARFYQAIVGGELRGPDPEDDWTELHTSRGKLAFQKAPNHVAPVWPDGPQQLQAHVDIDVPDLDEAEAAVLELGAQKHAVQPKPTSFRVYLDPAGHPFCLVREKT